MKLGVLAAMVVALAPIAHAQANDCTLMNRVVAAAKGGFAEIKGDGSAGGVSPSKVRFADANDCAIDASAEPFFYCAWSYGTTAEADAQSLVLLENAKFCLSQGWNWRDIAGQPAGDSYTILEGYLMSGSGANAGVHVQIHVEGNRDKTERLVWMEVYRE